MNLKQCIMLFVLLMVTFFNYISMPTIIAQSKNKYLIWSDEFQGTSLDTTKWSYRDLGARRDGVNVKETVSLDGIDNLIITTEKVGNKYHTGMIGTQGKFEYKFGYWECRMKLQKQQGHWSAFWLQSPTIGKNIGDVKNSGTEIDILEFLVREKNLVRHHLHWDGYYDFHKHVGIKAPIPNIREGFHKFALEWNEDEYIFYVDDNENWRTKEGVSQRTQYIILSLEVGKWGGDISRAVLPDSLVVDYVRVYSQNPNK